MKGLFVTGTDTEVGKTVVSALLLSRAQQIGSCSYIKPIQTGTSVDSDAETISQLIPGIRATQVLGFRRPFSPHKAAYLENSHIDFKKLVAKTSSLMTTEMTIVEGAGGLLVPLNNNRLMIDLIAELRLPVVLVARSTLGTINHSLLSLQALKQRQLGLAGIIMIGPPNPDNQLAISYFSRISPVVALPYVPSIDRDCIKNFAYHHRHNLDRLWN